MIQQQSILKVSDNSGAKKVKCIKVLGGFKKKYANIGDIIKITVQELHVKKKIRVKKKEVYKALIVETKIKLKKRNCFETILNENSVVLMGKKKPIGTRVPGALPKMLKRKKFKDYTYMAEKEFI